MAPPFCFLCLCFLPVSFSIFAICYNLYFYPCFLPIFYTAWIHISDLSYCLPLHGRCQVSYAGYGWWLTYFIHLCLFHRFWMNLNLSFRDKFIHLHQLSLKRRKSQLIFHHILAFFYSLPYFSYFFAPISLLGRIQPFISCCHSYIFAENHYFV